jgi:hypothetical protein
LIAEGVSISILSSIAWKSLGSPELVSITQNLLAFNRIPNQPLGTLPQFLVTLGGKIVFIDVMVVHDPLHFDLLIGQDCVYAMKAIVSTLFRVISFPHDGRVVTIDQLSFVGSDLTISSMTSLNGSYMHTVLPLPQVNYVALSPMPSVADEDEPLTVSSVSDDLDTVVDMVISSIGILPGLLSPIAALDMYSFQSVFLLSNGDLLEAINDFCPMTRFTSGASSSWKP